MTVFRAFTTQGRFFFSAFPIIKSPTSPHLPSSFFFPQPLSYIYINFFPPPQSSISISCIHGLHSVHGLFSSWFFTYLLALHIHFQSCRLLSLRQRDFFQSKMDNIFSRSCASSVLLLHTHAPTLWLAVSLIVKVRHQIDVAIIHLHLSFHKCTTITLAITVALYGTFFVGSEQGIQDTKGLAPAHMVQSLQIVGDNIFSRFFIVIVKHYVGYYSHQLHPAISCEEGSLRNWSNLLQCTNNLNGLNMHVTVQKIQRKQSGQSPSIQQRIE